MKGQEPYTTYSGYLKKRYGKKAYRVSVDGGFSCPNRGTGRTDPGCIYCDEQGSRAVYLEGYPETELQAQVFRGIAFLTKRYGAEIFLLYFQAFSSTYAAPKRLKEIYDTCLGAGDFRELIISTRPDCITPQVVELLAGYRRDNFDVWVELGLQSASNRTLSRINRGHTLEDFRKAFDLLKSRGLKTAVHVIFGLPGERWSDIRRTVDYLAAIRPEGVKIHNLHVPFNTSLFEEYVQGELTVPSDRRHLEYTIHALELLPEDIIIMRLTCDTPKKRRAAPRIIWKKTQFYGTIRDEMIKRKTWQGKLSDGEAMEGI
jgi:radical SAM protein (TIGR01212 family)